MWLGGWSRPWVDTSYSEYSGELYVMEGFLSSHLLMCHSPQACTVPLICSVAAQEELAGVVLNPERT